EPATKSRPRSSKHANIGCRTRGDAATRSAVYPGGSWNGNGPSGGAIATTTGGSGTSSSSGSDLAKRGQRPRVRAGVRPSPPHHPGHQGTGAHQEEPRYHGTGVAITRKLAAMWV